MAAELCIRSGRIALKDGDRAFRLEIDDFALGAGQAVALTGTSGAGKTLLLELLGLLRAPGAGTVYLHRDGQGGETDLAALWAQGPRNPDLARLRGVLFGFVPQTGGLLPFLTVAENIALPQRVNHRPDAARCRALMARLGIADIAALRPGALSIGQRQRAAIARALAHRPAFVIADEPTAALDPETADAVLALLLETARAEGAGLILSSHDIPRMERFGIARRALVPGRHGASEAVSRLQTVVPC